MAVLCSRLEWSCSRELKARGPSTWIFLRGTVHPESLSRTRRGRQRLEEGLGECIRPFRGLWPDAFRMSQDRGTGLLITGCREWNDYRASCSLSSDMALDFGLAVRVQGLRRYYSLVVTMQGKAELRKELNGTQVLARVDFPWTEGSLHAFSVEARGKRICGYINGKRLFELVTTKSLSRVEGSPWHAPRAACQRKRYAWSRQRRYGNDPDGFTCCIA